MPKIIKNKTDKFDYDNRLDKDHTQLTIDKNNLKLWLDLKSTPEDRSNYSNEISSLSYEGSATSTLEKVNNLYYNAARFDNSENINALVTYSSGDNPISFTDGAGNDKPFSISLLFKRSSSDSDTLFENFFGKSDGTSTNVSYSGGYGILGGLPRVTFYLNTNASNYLRVYSSVTPINDDEWVHFAYTYDGSNSESGLNVYINGVNVATNRQEIGTYSGMGHVGEKLYVGASTIGSNESDGQIAEFTIIDKELSGFEVNKLKDYLFEGIDGVIGSGYINNPARVILKDRDNQLNTYPRIKQLNDVESSFTLSSFNDNNAIIYGKKIADDFNLEVNKPDQLKRPVNLKKWAVSEIDSVIIRKEDMVNLPSIKPTPALPGALVLGGSTRWIRTVDKVKNPHLRFKVIVRPYSFENGDAINLSGIAPNTNTLKVQISSDASTWEDVDIETRNISNPAVRVVSGGLDPSSPLLSIGLNGGNRRYLKKNADGYVKPEYEVNIGPDQLNLQSDHNASFYIRIIQETIDNVRNATWALSEIEIISREQTTIGQTGLKRSNSYALTSSFATPNKLSNLTIQNSISLPHQSDNLFTINENNPTVAAFNDNKHVYDDSKEFYQYGVDPKIYPGFDQRLSNKRVFEYDLNTNEETKIGISNIENQSAESYNVANDIGQPMMCYWNKDLKRWETIGSLKPNLSFGFNLETQKQVITSSMLAFSSINSIATGSGASYLDSSLKIKSKPYLDTLIRPTDTFGFPFSGRYHATSSQYILAEELGITKNFLLEKIVIDFQAVIPRNSIAKELSFNNMFNNGYPYALNPGHSIEDLNFFILRQKNAYETTKLTVKRFDISGQESDFSYSEIIPSTFDLSNNGTKDVYVSDTREMITYGQALFLFSGSYQDRSLGSISFKDIENAFVGRDKVYSLGDTPHVTSSFLIESKCKACPVIKNNSYVVLGQQSGSYIYRGTVFTGKQNPGRSSGLMSNESRALLNGYTGFKISNNNENIVAPQAYGSPGAGSFVRKEILPGPSQVELTSPYIIQPKDKLIFGWATSAGTAFSPTLSKGYPTVIFGNSKLRLYGSEIKNGREYHTGLNQNLTTNAIHTVIGDDPVVDQFQIATRGELTGSFADDFPIKSDNSKVIFGKNLTVNETSRRIIDPRGSQPLWTREAFVPSKRLNVPVFSLTALDSYDFNPITKGFVNQSSFNFNLVDLARTFIDARYRITDNYYYATSAPSERPEYGSMQNIVANSGGSDATKLGGGPKYYFSGKHFGHYSDMIRQGLDGTFVDDPTTTADNIFTESPIRVKFVRGTYNEERRTREFIGTRVEEIEGTAEREFQSSNLSLYATSSIAYFDNNQVTNRTYGTYEISV